jgi:hypothetical protein
VTHTTPQRLANLFAITDRAVTADLFKIASAIAAGSTTASVFSETPSFLRAKFPDLSDNDLSRVALLMSWAMYLQHTATTRLFVRKWRVAKDVGVDNDAAHAIALTQSVDRILAALVEGFTTNAAGNEREEAYEKPTSM